MHSLKMLSIILMAMTLSVPPLAAQTSSGSIAGGLRDPQDGAVPSATVILTEQERKTQFTAKTDSEGRFVFPQLLPGRYRSEERRVGEECRVRGSGRLW